MYERLRKFQELVSRTIGFSLPLRLLIGAVLGLFGGSTFLGLISEFAGYSYAIHYGVRPPLEGIPYLRASVTLLSITVLFTGSLAFLLVYLLGQCWVKVFEGVDKLAYPRGNNSGTKGIEKIRNYPASKRYLIALALSILLTLGSILFRFSLSHLDPPPESSPVIWAAGAFSFGFLAYTIIFSPNMVRWLALIATVLVFGVAPVFLFHAHYYASLLRFIGYGGGLMIEVTYIEPEPETLRESTGALVLRTNEAIILYESTSKTYLEIPIHTIRSISYNAAKRRNSYQLPH